MKNLPLNNLDQHDDFISRHIGPQTEDISEMLEVIGVSSLDELADKTVPENIRVREPLNLQDSCSEREALETLRGIADKNKVNKSFIGMGYYDTIVPSVIQRNVLENPGRLEGLLNFQQMVMDLTGMDMANASLLDEATAAAEAMALCKRSNRLKTDKFFVDEEVFPQTLEVLKTRAQYFGFELIIGNPQEELSNHEVFGVLLQYPGTTGSISDIEPIIAQAHDQKALVCVAADLMSLVLLKAPGDMGADIVFGSSQRFGVPMGFGGPHAAFFAVRDKLKRSVPGRVIGVSVDSRGNQGLRMAMQTREQHIRRDKATSNILYSTSSISEYGWFLCLYLQRLYAKVICPKQNISLIPHGLIRLTIFVGDHQQEFYAAALSKGINLRLVDTDKLGVSFDETKTANDLQDLFDIFFGTDHGLTGNVIQEFLKVITVIHDFLTHDVFKQHHTETEMMRYLKRLENKDLSLVHAMIPLGSCTMKLNAAKEWLAEVTGYAAVSMQPNSGAQGEYAGLVAINRYNKSIGQGHRNICLTPTSAHGTNPASAAMARMKIVLVDCDENWKQDKTHAVSAAPFGSASILTISWMYMKLLGAEGNAAVSKMAILNANYITERLAPHYPVLYRGKNGRVAHECIIDIRPIKNDSGISEEDIAKRLMDYGFHAPTMSFPVAGTLMIEPTESESKYELDRFCDAMIAN
ncbi:Glycine dehydrogenase (decarboxylating) 2 [Nymphon striatum]|nr:Glycine dehydrogenase (decarboxylating) 2 [Nymphon striatum]